jgi:hypothetical protein
LGVVSAVVERTETVLRGGQCLLVLVLWIVVAAAVEGTAGAKAPLGDAILMLFMIDDEFD